METPDVVLDRIATELGDAAGLPLSCWTREELADWLCGLQGIRSRLDGLLCSAAIEAEHAAVPALDGARTVRAFVAGRCGTNPGDAGADLTLGRWLDQFDTITAALSAGRITRRHAHALRDLDNPRTRVLLREAQRYLVDAAANCSWDEFTSVCAHWMLAADPDGELPKEQTHKRRFSIKTNADGSVTGSFRLDTLNGGAVKNAVDREALKLFNEDAREGRHRTHPQRMADAFAALVARGTIRVDGTVGAPLIHISIGQDVIEEAISRAAADEAGVIAVDANGMPLGDDLGIDPNDPLRRCELIDGTPVHPSVVVGLLGVATLRRLVLGARGEVLDLGRSVRTFPRHLKEALLAAGRGRCATDNCDAPLAWLQADHVIPWTRNGRTATDNGQILCGSDNKSKGDDLPADH